jgi:hypothetical protein
MRGRGEELNMRYIVLTCAIAALLAGCGPTDTARMPQNAAGGPVMNQNDAIALASWALKDPANTQGNPERAARAIAAEDWLAGQVLLTPDFGQYAPVNEVSWGTLRREVRAAIGVAPGTPSQVLIDHLIAAADALKANDINGAKAQLQPPAFTLGPDRTLAALGALPPFPDREWAFNELNRNENKPTGNCMFNNC